MPKPSRKLLPEALLIAAVGLLLPIAASAQLPTIAVTRLDSTQVHGQLTSWTAEEVTLQTKERLVTLAVSQLLRVHFVSNPQSPTSPAPMLVELIDGTQIPHRGYEVKDGLATILTPLANQPLLLATEQVAFVQLTADAPLLAQVEQQLDGDLLVIRKKKTGTLDYLSGILGNVSAEQVVFNWDGEEIPVKRSKVAAIAYFHAKKPNAKKPHGKKTERATTPICWLILQNGARLPAAKIVLDNQKAIVNTTGGLQLTLSLKSIRHADYSQGKLAYLSDLQPLEQRWTPRIGLPTSAIVIRNYGLPRRDQSFTGSALTLRWPTKKMAGELKTYEKGLAIRSRSVCRYRLPKGMRRFITIAGIDPETASQGNVTLEIFADKKLVWHGQIEGGAAPTEIHVELGNARELRLVVDYGANLDFGDRLHLAEARLSR